MDRAEREILVHISAPSGARDDAQHLAQAEAYLTFDAVSRIQIYPGNDHAVNPQDREDRAFEREDGEGGTENEAGHEILNSGDELRTVGSPAPKPQYKTHSGIITRESPGIRRATELLRRSSTAPAHLERLHYGRDPAASPRRGFDCENCEARSTILQSAHNLSKTCTPSTGSQVGTDSLEFPPSVVEDSQISSRPLNMRDHARGSGCGVGLFQKRSPRASRASMTEPMNAPPSPNKRQRVGASHTQECPVDTTIESLIELAGTTSEAHSQNGSFEINPSPRDPLRSSLQSVKSTTTDDIESFPAPLPLEIHPPSPMASSAPFKSHITPTMRMLSDRLGLSRIFTPVWQARSLRILERGYWSLKITIIDSMGEDNRISQDDEASVWSLPFFSRFWSFLVDFIGKEARAGWGVWCVREMQNSFREEVVEPQLPRSEHIKIYCWGEVVPHVYLVLFLASERRIKGMHTQWRDAKDAVVLQMS